MTRQAQHADAAVLVQDLFGPPGVGESHQVRQALDQKIVHRQAASWFWDKEIFDFVGGRLHLIAPHSLRLYQHAWELNQADLDWRQAVLSRFLTGPALAVARLKANPTFASEAARVRAFVQLGAGCRARYYRHARQLRPGANNSSAARNPVS